MYRAIASSCLAAVVCLIFSPARGAEGAATHEITLDDYFSLATLFEVSPSPDGKSVVYAEARWQASTNDRKTDLWVVDAAGGPPRRLTFDRAGYGSLQWSPASDAVYVLAARKREGATSAPFHGKSQVWRVPLAGGEPTPVTQTPEGIDRFLLAADGSHLYYTTSRQETRDDWSKLRSEFSETPTADAFLPVTELFRLDLGTWRTDSVATLKKAVSDAALSPDGKRMAFITAPEDTVASFEGQSSLEVLDIVSGQWTTLPDAPWRAEAPSPFGRLNSLSWSADSQSLAFVIGFDGYPSELILARWQGATPTTARLARPEGVSLHAGVDSTLPMGWRDGKLCFLGEEKGSVRIYSAETLPPTAPKFSCVTPGDVVVESFKLNATGQAAAVIGGPQSLANVHFVESGAEPRRLTDVNAHTSSWKWPKLEIARWRGAGGVDVEGILELPPGATGKEKLPLIVFIHGGPTSMWTYQRAFNLYSLQSLMSSRGYAILSPNYRGSSGYGDKFLTDLIGHENDLDVSDILAGVDALVERGVADPERLAVIGWSNGGYLTNCVVTKTDRFKAASSGAGIADKVMNWGINDEPAYARVFAQGLPWQKPEVYHRSSPVLEFGKVRTPLLFHVGANDERCPPENSRMLYRALRESSQTPTELLVYPGEPHGLGRLQSRKAKLAWDMAWFDRYVRGEKESPAKSAP